MRNGHDFSTGYRHIEPPTRDQAYDDVVVGTGPGGATVARALARSGRSVLILERGERAEVTGGRGQTVRELLVPRRSLHLTRDLNLLRGNTVGGSSIYFFGAAWQPPVGRLAEHGLDVRPALERVTQELQPSPVPTEQMGPRASRVAESAAARGYDWQPIPKYLDASRLGGPPMGSYAAPNYEAKWNARKSVDQAVSAGASILTGALVQRVLVDAGSAAGLEFTHAGRRRTVAARRVILAAGGIGTPLVLRASGIERAGRDYFYDPLTSVVGEVDGLDADPELPMIAGSHLEDQGFMLTDICMPPWWFGMDAVLAGRPDRALSARRSLSIMVKVQDELSGQLTRRGGLGKPLTDRDHDRLNAGQEQARAILRKAGAERIWRTGYAAVHPGGTAKVGDVVDTDLQTEIPGLYVCDASVIPIPWGLPPSLTILALATRLGDHLTAQPQSRAPGKPVGQTPQPMGASAAWDRRTASPPAASAAEPKQPERGKKRPMH